jgi:hypothetical protein
MRIGCGERARFGFKHDAARVARHIAHACGRNANAVLRKRRNALL